MSNTKHYINHVNTSFGNHSGENCLSYSIYRPKHNGRQLPID